MNLGETVQWKQQQMNEGAGERGETPQRDSNVTGKDTTRRSIRGGEEVEGVLSLEGKVASWMAFRLAASSSCPTLNGGMHKEIYKTMAGASKIFRRY